MPGSNIFCGGQMAKHFAAALIRRIDPKRNVRQLLIVYYQPIVVLGNGRRLNTGPFQIKFPGGREEFGEAPKKTLRRELLVETGLAVRGATEICSIQTAFDHVQHFYLIEFDRCKNVSFSLKRMVEEKRSNLGPFEWVDEDLLEPILHHSHRRAFREYKQKFPKTPVLAA